MKASVLFASAAFSAALMVAGSSAHATITITSAHVLNTYTYDNGAAPSAGDPAAGSTVFDATPPASSFTTFDGQTGFTSVIDPNAGGYFRVNAFGTTTHNSGGPADAHGAASSGTILFSSDTPFTLARGTPLNEAGGGFQSGQIVVKNLSTNQSFTLAAQVGSPSVSNTLPPIAPAGSYEVDFSLQPFSQTGQRRAGALEVGISVPEPIAFAVVAPALLAVRRRRK